MKVTIVGPAYPLRGGIAHHVYWLWRELTRRGHAVQVISFKKLYPAILFPGKTIFDESSRKLDASALPLLDPLTPATWGEAYRTITAFAPDVVTIQWWNPFFAPLTGTLGRRLKRARIHCLMECHNVLPHERSRLDAALTRFAVSPIRHFITHSHEDKQNLIDFYPAADVRVAPLPSIDEFSKDEATPSSGRDGRTILFFGIVRKYKGLDLLLRALPKILSQIDCRLLVTGEFYEPEEKYRRLIDELGIENSVTLENRYIPNEAVAGLLNRADVLILPYRSATQSAVARLAVLGGLPIIASNTGGLSEVVEDGVNGFLFKVGDIDDLAEKLIRYFKENCGPRFAENIAESRRTSSSPDVADLIEEIARKHFS